MNTLSVLANQWRVSKKQFALPLVSLSAALFSLPAFSERPLHHHIGSTFDIAIANEERLIGMLKRDGDIPVNASSQDEKKILQEYLRRHHENSIIEAKKLMSSDSDSAMLEASALAGPAVQSGMSEDDSDDFNEDAAELIEDQLEDRPRPIQLEGYTGPVRTAKVLAILMEFPDFPHNSVLEENATVYYEDYNPKHYSDMLFSQTGFAAPSGEILGSMTNFYNAQSGGSYNVSGAVAGWYMAKNPAAFYGEEISPTRHDTNPRALIIEALNAAASDPSINLADFDIEDRFDYDNDGDLWEPDGLVDHIMVFHSAIGQESGGGQLGKNAIWSHRSVLAQQPYEIPNSTSTSPNAPNGLMSANDYTIQATDSIGTAFHEYGHDLGLPDEYDTAGNSRGEPVSYWSLMAAGSWAGEVAGMRPVGFSAWAKEFLQKSLGGNWQHGSRFHVNSLDVYGKVLELDQAVSKGKNNDVVRVDLPLKQKALATPTSGKLAYYSGNGNRLNNYMLAPVTLPAAASVTLNFNIHYDIEEYWDYAYVGVVDSSGAFVRLPGNVTTDNDPYGVAFGPGITGTSEGWIAANFDLSAFAGQNVTLAIQYVTDAYVANRGLLVDDISVSADGSIIFADDAESTPKFALFRFTQNPGYTTHEHYYLMEWRTHVKEDRGLSAIKRRNGLLSFNEGLLVWYVDDSYDANHVAKHPGNGFLGVVDADQNTLFYNNGTAAATSYQVHDAAFSRKRSTTIDLLLGYDDAGAPVSLVDKHTRPYAVFDDGKAYMTPEAPQAGRAIVPYGLKMHVVSQSKDKSVGKIWLRYSDPIEEAMNEDLQELIEEVELEIDDD